jgi:peptide/nickel transport system permease protein
MHVYFMRRMLWALPTLFLVSVWIFLLMHLVPGDAIIAKISAAGTVPKENIDAARHELGLDKPLLVQYVSWIGGVLRLDPGTSLWYGRPVLGLLLEALPVTLELAILTMVIATVVGYPLGIISAIYQDSKIDVMARIVSVGGQALPDFWNAIVLIVVLSRFIGYLPPIFYTPFWEDPFSNLQQMLLPAAALGYRMSATSMRLMRSSLLEVMRQDYVRTATAKGLTRRMVIVRHALKNALIPVLTDFGTSFAFLLGGEVVLESLFGLPGLGLLTVQAVLQRDYPLIQAAVLFVSAIIILANVAVDISYGIIDPRVRPHR